MKDHLKEYWVSTIVTEFLRLTYLQIKFADITDRLQRSGWRTFYKPLASSCFARRSLCKALGRLDTWMETQ